MHHRAVEQIVISFLFLTPTLYSSCNGSQEVIFMLGSAVFSIWLVLQLQDHGI